MINVDQETQDKLVAYWDIANNNVNGLTTDEAKMLLAYLDLYISLERFSENLTISGL